MKRILFILALLWSVAQAQTVTPSAGPYTTQNAKYVWTWGKYTGGVWIPGKLVVEDSARFYGLTYVPLAPDGDSTDKAASTKWIKQNISPGIPGQPTSAWNTTGNYATNHSYKYTLGFLDSNAIHIKTSGADRLVIPVEGIEKSTNSAHRVMLIDTATHIMYFGDPSTGGGISLGQLNDSLARYVTNAFQVDDSLLYIVYGGTAHLFATIHSGGSGDTTSLSNRINAKLDTAATYVNAGAINWPGALYTSPTNGVVTGHKIIYTPPLATQSAYSLFGNRSGSSGAPAFFINPFIDSFKISTDTLFGRVNGSWVFQGKSSVFAQWVSSGTSIYYNNGNVGIGTSTPPSLVTLQNNSIGMTSDETLGLQLVNNTAATSGTQKYSPALVFTGQGWKTASTAASQKVSFLIENEPSQGGTNPLGTLSIKSSINNGSYTNVFSIGNAGAVQLYGSLGAGFISAGDIFSYSKIRTYGNFFGGFLSSSFSDFYYDGSVGNTGTSGTPEHNGFMWGGIINNTGGNTVVRGFYYNPTNTSLTNTSSIGFQNTSGNNLFGTASGSTIINGSTTTANRNFDVQGTTVASSPYPKMTTTQRLALSPSESDGVYDLTLHKLYIYDGTIWQGAW